MNKWLCWFLISLLLFVYSKNEKKELNSDAKKGSNVCLFWAMSMYWNYISKLKPIFITLICQNPGVVIVYLVEFGRARLLWGYYKFYRASWFVGIWRTNGLYTSFQIRNFKNLWNLSDIFFSFHKFLKFFPWNTFLPIKFVCIGVGHNLPFLAQHIIFFKI